MIRNNTFVNIKIKNMDFKDTVLKFSVSDEIRKLCPDYVGAAVICREVVNSVSNHDLWEQIDDCVLTYREFNTLEDIKRNPAIRATREAYKRCGKDPNRYRPSAEALCRRIVRELPLHRIDTLVDVINLISVRTGYSIGGFDIHKIADETLTLGIGRAGESFNAIGRGQLNIEGLPVFRDAIGGVGTPTSDEERTKLDLNTTGLLAIVNGYNGKDGLPEAAESMVRLLKQYALAQNIEILYF